MRLALIGYWLGRHEPGWPDVRSFVDSSWNVDEQQAVIDWLESGVEIRFFLGRSLCRLCGQPNGAAEASDGTYLWPVGLTHYVREHSVRLPMRLVERAGQRPPVDRNRLEAAAREDEEVTVDDEWWRNQRADWLKARRQNS
jgi:hypothetical protein